MKMGGATYYLDYDQVGSIRLVADGSGNVVKRISYDSFGNILEDTNPSFTIPFGFAGGLHDRDTGLVRFGYRDYDPEVGRWTAKDPIGFAGGDTYLYGYTLNNPINLIDPWGLFWEYSQSTGQMTHVDNQTGDRTSFGAGYAGTGEGLNNPNMQNVPFVGPIPQGTYDIGEATTTRGPLTLPLTPQQGTNTFGRDAFRIHGDNSRLDQSASEGCIVTGRNVRNQINNSQDRDLRVIP